MVQDVDSCVYPSRTLSFRRFLLETCDLIARVQSDQSERPRVSYREDCDRGLGTARHMGARVSPFRSISLTISPLTTTTGSLPGIILAASRRGPPVPSGVSSTDNAILSPIFRAATSMRSLSER